MDEKFSWFQILFYITLATVLGVATFTIRGTFHYPYLLFLVIACVFAERVLGLLFTFVRKSIVNENGSVNIDIAYHIIFDFLKITSMIGTVGVILAILVFKQNADKFLTGVLITVLASIIGALLTLKSGWIEKSRSIKQ